jgi:hypothetical protein
MMIREVFGALDRRPYFPDDHGATGHITCEICQHILSSCLGVFEITDANPNVMLELGLAYGAGKHCVLLRRKAVEHCEIPADLSGIQRIHYDNEVDVREKLQSTLKQLNLPTWPGHTHPQRYTVEIQMTDHPGSLGLVAAKMGEMKVNICTVTTCQRVPGKAALGIFTIEVPPTLDLADVKAAVCRDLPDDVLNFNQLSK